MIGIRFTPATVVWATCIAVVGGWVLSLTDPAWWGRVIAGLLWVLALSCMVTVQGDTLRQWIVRRWRVRDKLKVAWLVDANRRAMVWDGQSVSMIIETHGDPWALSTVASDGSSTARKIPLDDLREQLRQFDIRLEHIRVVEMGYKTAVSHERASASLISTMGNVGHLLGGRTFVAISVSLRENLNPVASRTKLGDTDADGLTRTINIATARVLRVFQQNNIEATVVSPTTALAIHKEILGGVGEAANHNTWHYAGVPGDGSIGTVVSFTPGTLASWNPALQNQWNEVLAHRQYNCLTLSTDGDRDRIGYATTYLVDDPGMVQLLPSQGLRRENGRHLARVSNVLPLSRDIVINDDGGRMIERDDENIGIEVPVHPLGIYLGVTADTRERAFMHVTRSDAPLWIVGDDEYARRLILRLSTQKHRIAVSVATPEWAHLIKTRRSQTLIGVKHPGSVMARADVLVITPEQLQDIALVKSSPAVFVVSPTAPLVHTDNLITRVGDIYEVVVRGERLEILRESPPTERPWLELHQSVGAR